MPIQPVTGTLSLPLGTREDVGRLLECTITIAEEASASRRRNVSRDLGDHWAFLAGTHPDWFRPYQERFSALNNKQLETFELKFEDLAVLMHCASDACVDALNRSLQQNPEDSFRESILASIGTDYSLEALAAHARGHSRESRLADLGVSIPKTGPARWRFSRQRLAVFSRNDGSRETGTNPIGLALQDCVETPQSSPIAWHYLSVSTEPLSNIVRWPRKQLHLVSPRVNCQWTLFARTTPDGRYTAEQVVREDDGDDDDFADMLIEVGQEAENCGHAELRPYDGELTYSNAHIMCTEGVVGTVGGPPTGLVPNPNCPECGLLMFHVLSVEHDIRPYGDGFRSLYVCETCETVACTGTGWN